MSSPIRVVVGNLPRLLRDIIEDAIARQPDMVLVDETGGDVATLAGRCDVDVAILAGGTPDRATRHRHVLIERPEIKILVIADDGRDAQLLELRRRPLPDVSPSALLDAIRAAFA